ncbi:outer membrane autotransporter barrel domain-containing protein [Alteromonadaceae bacterium Bs31]|nr:outer membrane autotransporter barrel domain-containing protein [Alteromonadaceae bacterium Bs31]
MRILLLVLALLLAPLGFADNLRGFYAGGNLDFIDGNTTDASGNDTGFRALEVTGGYKHNSWLGGEVRVGFGVSGEDYSIDVGGDIVDVDVSIDHFESIYYRAESSNSVAKLYGLLGYSNVQTSSELQGDSSSSSKSGPSYGVGVGFAMRENSNLNFEYRQIINSDGAEFTALNIGFDYRF